MGAAQRRVSPRRVLEHRAAPRARLRSRRRWRCAPAPGGNYLSLTCT
ncbi:MAG: hypothetical protein MZW92_00390 [Comamonadaceae bacterium]|nr:hypothetical protein [Comamonadaceae bacterium]